MLSLFAEDMRRMGLVPLNRPVSLPQLTVARLPCAGGMEQSLVLGEIPGWKLVVFWAPDCPACTALLEEAQDIAQRLKPGLTIVPIAMATDLTVPLCGALPHSLSFAGDVLFDQNGGVAERFAAFGTPAVYVVSPAQEIVAIPGFPAHLDSPALETLAARIGQAGQLANQTQWVTIGESLRTPDTLVPSPLLWGGIPWPGVAACAYLGLLSVWKRIPWFLSLQAPQQCDELRPLATVTSTTGRPKRRLPWIPKS
jgi:thiol-disulfide isomerase/thioredoxin